MSSEQHARHPVQGQPSPEHGSNGDDAAPGAAESGSKTDVPADAAQQELTEREGLKLLLKQFQELREYVSYYVTAKTDSAKLSLRNTVLWISFAALGFVAVAGLIVMASWFALSGIAQGVGALFGDRAWIGAVITGVLALAGVGLGVSCAASTRKNAARKRTVRKYETRHARQRARFGRDVQD
jgi:hypothetical protein